MEGEAEGQAVFSLMILSCVMRRPLITYRQGVLKEESKIELNLMSVMKKGYCSLVFG